MNKGGSEKEGRREEVERGREREKKKNKVLEEKILQNKTRNER